MDFQNATPRARPARIGKKRERSGLSRRSLLAGICASAVLAACSSTRPPTAEAEQQGKAAAQGQALATGEMDRWARLVGTNFRTLGFELKLAGVQPLPSSGVRPPDVTRHAAFVAVFEVLAGGPMPGDLIYAMSSSSYALDVFLASAATAEFPNRMHAVFN